MYDDLKSLFGDKHFIVNINSDGPMDTEHNSSFVPIIIPDSDNG